jgi:pimeloyl-ACP methyl ester carboxylesterase
MAMSSDRTANSSREPAHAAAPCEGVVRLRDGRRLGYAEYGRPDGRPVFYFHGFPGCRLEAALVHEIARALGVRMTAFDRPGYGLSDAQPDRTLRDWANDVSDAADALGIERFAVLGVSGGGPYALACAHAIPERLTATAVVAGLAPVDRPELRRDLIWPMRAGFFLGRRAPWLFGLFAAGLVSASPHSHADYVMRLLGGADGEADRRLAHDPRFRRAIVSSIREALRRGAHAARQDVQIYARAWGFSLNDISTPVDIWHGEADGTVPATMGRYLAQQLPQCRARFLPGEGHFSLPYVHAEKILLTLVQSQDGTTDVGGRDARASGVADAL